MKPNITISRNISGLTVGQYYMFTVLPAWVKY